MDASGGGETAMSENATTGIAADLARSVRSINSQLGEFVDAVGAMRREQPVDSPLWNRLSALQLRFAVVLAESRKAVCLLAAGQVSGLVEKVPVSADSSELHPSRHGQEHAPPFLDGRSAAANDRLE